MHVSTTSNPILPQINNNNNNNILGIEIKMTELTKPDLTQVLDTSNPTLALTLMDINTFFKQISEAFAMYKDHWNEGGMDWLLEDKDKHKSRLNYEDKIPDPNDQTKLVDNPTPWVMPTMPTKPLFNSAFTTLEHRMYVLDVQLYDWAYHFNQGAIEAVKQKFSNCLSELKVVPDRLPLHLTLQRVKQHLVTKAKKENTVSMVYKNLSLWLLNLEFKPNADGATEFFKAQRILAKKVDKLKIEGRPTTPTYNLIAFAKDAFLNSGHDCTRVSSISSK